MLSLTILFVMYVYRCWFSIKIKGTNFISKYAQVQKKIHLNVKIPRPFFIFCFRRDGFLNFFPNFWKSEFGGFEKQEIKLF